VHKEEIAFSLFIYPQDMSFSPINPFKLVLLYSRLTFNLPKLPYSFLPLGHLFNPIITIFSFIWNHFTTRPSVLWITIGCGYHFSHFNPILSVKITENTTSASLFPFCHHDPSSDLSGIMIPPSHLNILLLKSWFLLQISTFLFCNCDSSFIAQYCSATSMIPPSVLNIPFLPH